MRARIAPDHAPEIPRPVHGEACQKKPIHRLRPKGSCGTSPLIPVGHADRHRTRVSKTACNIAGSTPDALRVSPARCRSSGVEHSLGKGEVESSNLSGSTIKSQRKSILSQNERQFGLQVLVGTCKEHEAICGIFPTKPRQFVLGLFFVRSPLELKSWHFNPGLSTNALSMQIVPDLRNHHRALTCDWRDAFHRTGMDISQSKKSKVRGHEQRSLAKNFSGFRPHPNLATDYCAIQPGSSC